MKENPRNKPKVIGLTRIKDEKMLIKEHLAHLAKFCDEIYIFDDGSTDGTLEIIKKHPQVNGHISNADWKPSKWIPRADPLRLAWKNKRLLKFARQKSSLTTKDWLIFLDVDERFEEDFKEKLQKIINQDKYDVVVFELYDFFLTPEDWDLPYNGNLTTMRKYCGNEYRLQPFVYRNLPNIFCPRGSHREFFGYAPRRVWYTDWKIRHYGKAKSVEDYKNKASWYRKYRGEVSDKDYKFKKPPIHKNGKSDLGTLVTWEQLKANPKLRGKLFYKYQQLPFAKYKWTFYPLNFALKVRKFAQNKTPLQVLRELLKKILRRIQILGRSLGRD